jgi:outer membrane protein TolC
VGGSVAQLQASPALDVASAAGRLLSPPIFPDDRIGVASAEVTLPLFTSGQIPASVQAARATAQVAREGEVRTAQDLRLAVAQAYVEVLRRREALKVSDSQVASLRAHAADAQRLYAAQNVALTDVLASRVALANAEQARLRAQNAVQMATAVYNRYLGEDLSRVPQLDDNLAVIAEGTLGSASLQALGAQALRARPELAAAAQAADAYQQQARAERARNGPQLALDLGYYHIDNRILNRQDFAYVGVGVRWTLFDGGQTRARATALRSRARAEQQQLQDERSRIELQVQEAWLDRAQAQARLTSAAAAVMQAEENLRVARQIYEAGSGTSTQVLDAEALRLTALSNRDNAQFDLWVADFRLERAAGSL